MNTAIYIKVVLYKALFKLEAVMRIMSQVLENGLHVFLVPMAGVKTICGTFIVRAGWKFEQPGINEGAAHFLEHMAFKATTNYPEPGKISLAIESIGGIFNASTGPDAILYYIKTPTRHLDTLYALLEDIILHPLLRDEDIEMEKGPVKEELAMYQANPAMNLNALILPKLLFEDHPAGWPGTGTKEQIERLNRNLLLDHYANLFVGRNAAICFAGKIPDPDYLFTELAYRFRLLSSYHPGGKKIPYRENQTKPRIIIENQEIPQTYLSLGIKCPSVKSPQRSTLTVLNAILGGRQSSRLFQEIRERRGLAYDIQSYLDLQSDLGVLVISAGLDQNRWKEGLQTILNELSLLRAKAVETDELEMVKEMLLGHKEMAIERPEVVAQACAANWTLRGKVENFEQSAREIKAVTASDVHRAAREILRNDRISLAVMGPHKNEEHEIQELFHIKD